MWKIVPRSSGMRRSGITLHAVDARRSHRARRRASGSRTPRRARSARSTPCRAVAGSATEQVLGEPVLRRAAWRSASRSSSTLRCAIASLRWTNTFGAPRSPSYFGISYSRIRWSRNVFHVSSQASRWSWCRSRALVREDHVRRDARPSAPRRTPSPRRRRTGRSRRGSSSTTTCDDAKPRRKSCRARARLVRARPRRRSSTTQHDRRRRDASRRAAAACRRSRSRCRRRARRARGSCASRRERRDRAQAEHQPARAGRGRASAAVAASQTRPTAPRPLSSERLESVLVLERVHRRPEAVVRIGEQLPLGRSGAGTARRRDPRPPRCSRRSRGGRRSSRR